MCLVVIPGYSALCGHVPWIPWSIKTVVTVYPPRLVPPVVVVFHVGCGKDTSSHNREKIPACRGMESTAKLVDQAHRRRIRELVRIDAQQIRSRIWIRGMTAGSSDCPGSNPSFIVVDPVSCVSGTAILLQLFDFLICVTLDTSMLELNGPSW